MDLYQVLVSLVVGLLGTGLLVFLIPLAANYFRRREGLDDIDVVALPVSDENFNGVRLLAPMKRRALANRGMRTLGDDQHDLLSNRDVGIVAQTVSSMFRRPAIASHHGNALRAANAGARHLTARAKKAAVAKEAAEVVLAKERARAEQARAPMEENDLAMLSRFVQARTGLPAPLVKKELREDLLRRRFYDTHGLHVAFPKFRKRL
jgi:hypothetical protein